MEKTLTVAGAVLAFLAVVFGTFAAHVLSDRLSLREVAIFETGVRYQMFHALATILAAWAVTQFNPGWATAAGWLFVAGAVIFGGSLYALATSSLWAGATVRWLGAITPIGGVCFLAGWACFIVAVFRPR